MSFLQVYLANKPQPVPLTSYINFSTEFGSAFVFFNTFCIGLGKIIEWIISSYKCACFVERIIDIENERLSLISDIGYKMIELKEEESEMWEYEETYRSLTKEVVDAETRLEKANSRLNKLQRVLDTGAFKN